MNEISTCGTKADYMQTVAIRTFKCSRCFKEKPGVIDVDNWLICVKCRYEEIGKDAFYEGLYNGF